ncbi:MAG: hypothetical protein LBD46_06645 [Endomicrobium sp.]|jgi:hypothetical protein|nr:hypothetical protein [Endomicrobium sp.]
MELKSLFNKVLGMESASDKSVFDNPFPFDARITEKVFIDFCIENLYKKILTDCFSNSRGLPEDVKPFFWDTVVKSYGESNADKGLISLLSKAMLNQDDLLLIYKSGVLRVATPSEQNEIKDGFKNNRPYSNGFYFTFKDYTLTEILKMLYAFQYVILSATYSNINVSKAIQLKIHDFRALIANNEKENPKKQGKELVEGMSEGKPVMFDELDSIELAKIDMSATETAISFINGLIAFYLNSPMSYVNGILTSGISTTGESDEIAIERCLTSFFYPIFKPVVDKLFNLKISFKSNKWRKFAAISSLMPFVETSTLLDDKTKKDLMEELFQ